MKKSLIFFPILTAILILAVFLVNKKNEELSQPVNFLKATQPIIMENPELQKTPEEVAIITEKALESVTLPDKHSNTVAFTSQAPYAKWDDLHDEACEEASIIMAHNYLIETDKIEIRTAEDEIQKMVTFQKEYFGFHKDLTAEEMIELANKFYKEEYQLIDLSSEESTPENKKITTSEESVPKTEEILATEETTQISINEEKIEYIKKELSNGNIFIIPAAGQKLENPYFRIPGPLYHALIIIGYDDSKKEFITHDPGTRRGENYHYSQEVIWNAIHDFPSKRTNILQGAKNIILVKKES